MQGLFRRVNVNKGGKLCFTRKPGFLSSTCDFRASAARPCTDYHHDHLLFDEPDAQSPAVVEDVGNTKMVVLNRPNALNALDTTMASKLLRLYRSWRDNHNVGLILLKGNGRAFCAGGDVVSAYHMINQGRLDDCKRFFRTCYNLIYLISCFPKPQVAILNGITMGGGSGISVPGRFRLATDKTVFAVPETLIGFHPDGAASYYLPRLPGRLGEFLALTGDKLNGAEMVACGLATHYLHSSQIPLIEEKLGRLDTDDPSTIGDTLDHYCKTTSIDDQSILNKMELINECFGCDTIEDIFEALESKANKEAESKWCSSTLKKLKQISPLSLKVSLRSIREGRFQTLDQCIRREYWMTLHAIHGTISRDFSEGVRARLVDKTFTPKWYPTFLNQVSEDMVEKYFSSYSQIESPQVLTSRH